MKNSTEVTDFILLGLTDDPQLQIPLFIIFTFIYLITGNSTEISVLFLPLFHVCGFISDLVKVTQEGRWSPDSNPPVRCHAHNHFESGSGRLKGTDFVLVLAVLGLRCCIQAFSS